MAKTFDALEAKIDTVALPHLRGAILGALKRVATSPFAYSAADHIDFEQSSIAILENALTVPLKSGKMRSPAERLLAVKALVLQMIMGVAESTASIDGLHEGR